MATERLSSPPRSWLERTIASNASVFNTLNTEVIAYLVLIVLSFIAHLWGLGTMAMHHDEAIHAWSTWNFYTGKGGFTCANGGTSATYCYDPVYHGPSLYILGLLSFFLFGDGDAQSRLPMAMAGVGLVASCWMLRPLIGKRSAFVAAILLGFSPSLLYFTRFNRHDGLMVLWELWMVIGAVAFLRTGKPRYLYLLAASIALAIGTHELYYIVFFIFGMFVLVRLIAESNFQRFLSAGLLSAIGACIGLIIINPPLPFGSGLYLGEHAFLIGTTLLLLWLSQHVWPREPLLIPRLHYLWYEQRRTLWIAVSILVSLYVVMYTTFFTYPRGAIDGLYAGLAYWLGSQHEFARGDQPWYYYLMQLPLYEPLGIVGGIGAAIYLYSKHFSRRARKILSPYIPQLDQQEEMQADSAATEPSTEPPTEAKSSTEGSTEPSAEAEPSTTSATSAAHPSITLPSSESVVAMMPLLLIFWYISATVIFSWAGEKMPWLLVHMSLPGNLIAAWTIGRLIPTKQDVVGVNASDDTDDTPESANTTGNGVSKSQRIVAAILVPPVVALTVIAFSVAFWRIGMPSGEGQQAQMNLLQALVPLLAGGALIYVLWLFARRIGTKTVFSLVGMTGALVLGAYMLRSTWLVVYHHPDTPIEPLIYTQSSPDVPRYVEDFKEMSINLARNHRSAKDVTGGYSMPIIADSGDKSGGGSLAWPYQWYFRRFTNISWMKSEVYSSPTDKTFQVDMPNGSKELAPVVMLYQSHINEELRTYLEQHYVRPYGDGGVLNWWFPEGNKCSPSSPGYKRFYYNSWMHKEAYTKPASENGCGNDISDQLEPPWAPLLWPLQLEHWQTLKDYILYRDLPSELQLGSRDLVVWVRSDLVQGVPSEGSASGVSNHIRLVAEQSYGEKEGLQGPTGIAVGEDGTIYVADTQNHRILVFDEDGDLEETYGEYGDGKWEFNEPRGVAVDEDDNLYVADTWNARVVKISAKGTWLDTWGTGTETLGGGRMATQTGGTQEGNAKNPLGFFGPRGIYVDDEGNVYIADTGNKRIVVTDNEGEFLYQWGYAGSGHGQFNEPTNIGIDKRGNVYVADTWNGRVQVFPKGSDGQVLPTPEITWQISGWNPDTYDDPSLGVNPDGDVYASVPKQHAILATNMRGDVLLRWGGTGNDLASLNSPSGVTVGPEGDVYVVDRSANRILRFKMPDVQPAHAK